MRCRQRDARRAALVDRTDGAMMDEQLDEDDLNPIRDVMSRVGLAEVREFGLIWEGCEATCRGWDTKRKWTSFE